jgi:uncharacterized integral membrane protein
LNNFDIYGEPVMLSFKKHERFSTPLGIVLSFAIMGAVFVLFLSLTYDMISHSNPSLVSKIEANLDPEV